MTLSILKWNEEDSNLSDMATEVSSIEQTKIIFLIGVWFGRKNVGWDGRMCPLSHWHVGPTRVDPHVHSSHKILSRSGHGLDTPNLRSASLSLICCSFLFHLFALFFFPLSLSAHLSSTFIHDSYKNWWDNIYIILDLGQQWSTIIWGHDN